MSKVLKTGDVKRIPRGSFIEIENENWAVVDHLYRWSAIVASTREMARARRNYWCFGRIARILSIGPKLVTVRIEK